jgi:hypothetical protein
MVRSSDAGPEGDKLDVAAVRKWNKRVMRATIGMRTSRRHGEAKSRVIGDCLIELGHDDDHVVQLHRSISTYLSWTVYRDVLAHASMRKWWISPKLTQFDTK